MMDPSRASIPNQSLIAGAPLKSRALSRCAVQLAVEVVGQVFRHLQDPAVLDLDLFETSHG